MKIEELSLIQNPDGGFGRFHSMSQDKKVTTEKALRRFVFLNLDKEFPIVKKSLDYLRRCLHKEITIPDRREKVINWDAFEELMFSAWLNIFQVNDEKVTNVKLVWKQLIENSIIDNKLNVLEYKKQYRFIFGKEGSREISPSIFYVVCLLKEMLSPIAKQAYFQYVMEQGIYYIYDRNLNELPLTFDSKRTIDYLLAIKLISPYANSKKDLAFVKVWLESNRSWDGTWNMPNLKPDGVIFPISDNWRKFDNKLTDINMFINRIWLELL